MKPLRFIILFLLAAFIVVARYCPAVGEWYAVGVYPVVSAVLSFLVSWIPFSMEEVFVMWAVALAVWIIVRGVMKRQRWYRVVLRETEMVAWIVVWFYVGWGMNYFRESVYERGAVGKQKYNEVVFNEFLKDYAENLNASFVDSVAVPDINDFSVEVKELYAQVPREMGLSQPRKWMQPKRLLLNKLYSSVGVLGFMGPFFNEIQLNGELLPEQLPFCYAHELSHQLGVSNEDEANYWAYRICRNSEDPQVRYSAYFSLLPYVLTNASRVLLPDEYQAFQCSIRPEVLSQFTRQQQYWRDKYSKTLGEVQNLLYNAMLKGNKVPSGTANYIQVIDMIIAFEYPQPMGLCNLAVLDYFYPSS